MSRAALVTEVTVATVSRLSPAFVRVELAAPELADFGVDGAFYDQRIKLVVPTREGLLAPVPVADEHWYDAWSALPVERRGHLRTYSVRAVRGSGEDTRLVVDFVLHLEPGRVGPASRWASTATVGDRLLLIGPRRGHAWGGIEFAPDEGSRLLLVGDETAAPAICRILGDLPPEATGDVFVEVPDALDVLDVRRPPGVRVEWLPRGGARRGERLVAAVTAHLGTAPGVPAVAREDPPVDDLVWETPTWSSAAGSPVAAEEGAVAPGTGLPGLYAWIAGEAGTVTRLRRHLVTDHGMARRQVAFMGYWREGVAAAG